MKDYLLGMDLGTTNAKAVLFNTQGVALASASVGYPLRFPGPNMVEQSAGDWWTAAVQILRQVTDQVGGEVVAGIRGISISSQLPSLLPLDRDGNVLRDALIWMDKRSHHELDEILEVIGRDEYVASAGVQPDVAFLPSKILWYSKHEPELFAKTFRILQANGYINYRLTGSMAMDLDQAVLCQCLDLRTSRWSESLSRAIGADLNTVLPEPVSSDTIIGHVTGEAARQTGLCRGIPVVAGASDATASMYATGLCRTGEAAESSGTTSLLFVGHNAPTRPDIPVVARPCPFLGMPYLFNAPINATGASIKWYLTTLGKADIDDAKAAGLDAYEYLNRQALEAPAGGGGLLYFPYMLGERAPLWNSHAKGMFIGLSLDTERKHMIRSIFEGTAFAIRHVIDTIQQAGGDPQCLRVAGGGARSRTWSQIKASMLRMPVYILDEKTGDIPFGDALIAGQGVGVYPNLADSIEKMIQIKEVIDPVPEWADVYDQLYPYYLQMYRHLDEDLQGLKTTMEAISMPHQMEARRAK